ncbi:cytochrome P450 monooxygenase [Aspergillus cavernicola]|uniref:Cytochrome P450 monooxygenase n=1 Tax=Aspergillus cavernicola TaxID=176166 RepID=A0ABR4HWQ1_9EURO
MLWSIVPLILFGSWLWSTGWPLYRNWRRAKALNLPIILSPISRQGVLHRTGSWTFREKFSIHAKYGKIFILVTPITCDIYVADGKAAKHILDRRNEFLKPNKLLAKIAAFGQNLATVEGEQWQRHRRLTGRAFHDQTHRIAWDEAYKHASFLVKTWDTSDTVRSPQSDMARLSLNVLFDACFDLPHQTGSSGVVKDVASLQTHLEIYLRSLTHDHPAILQAGRASGALLGESIQRLIENRKASDRKPTQSDLLSSMMMLPRQSGLSESEIAGNLFLFFFAGHETTASTLLYITNLLAIFPKWQDWAIEEVDKIVSEFQSDTPLEYQSIYPRWKRLRAILYETIRLYGPVPTIVRATNDQDQTLPISNGEIVVSKNTSVNINCMALHTDPDVWGEDCLEWNPGRWISTASDSSLEDELFPLLSKGFFGWGSGPRICPGQRFSQIEVLAVLVCLLRNHYVTIVPEDGQSFKEAQLHTLRMIENSSMLLTLQMSHVQGMRLVKR